MNYGLLVVPALLTSVVAQPPLSPSLPMSAMHNPSMSVFSSLFNTGGYGRRGQPFVSAVANRFTDDYFDMPQSMGLMSMPANRMVAMASMPYSSDPVVLASLSDKDNFQPQGCGWDGIRNRCSDGLNLCKGGCFDYGVDVSHDCRCIPFGFMALLGLGR